MKKGLSTLILICSLLFTIQAQRGWEIGGWLGASHYFGDLNTNFYLGDAGLAGGLVTRYNFDKRICLKLSANFGSVAADDANSKNAYERARNLSFKSSIADAALSLEFNFLPYVHGSNDHFFTPYMLAGFSMTKFDPQAELNGTWYELRPLGTEGQFRGTEYYQTSGGFVFGGGLKFDLNYDWSLNLEISMRQLFTDYLDDVSTVYAEKDDIENERGEIAMLLSDRSILIPGINDGELGEPGRQRGNSKNNDSYIMLGLGLVYYFGDIRCPEYSR